MCRHQFGAYLGLSPHSNKATTFPFENAKNIRTVAVSPDGVLMITVDEGGYLVASPNP